MMGGHGLLPIGRESRDMARAHRNPPSGGTEEEEEEEPLYEVLVQPTYHREGTNVRKDEEMAVVNSADDATSSGRAAERKEDREDRRSNHKPAPVLMSLEVALLSNRTHKLLTHTANCGNGELIRQSRCFR